MTQIRAIPDLCIMMYLTKTPSIIKPLGRDLCWNIHTDSKTLYLTFDDGPLPGVTEWVLDCLDRWDAKATFFCVGDNVRKHPEIFQQLVDRGHAVGNHTFNHLNGWKTDDDVYLANVELCAQLVPSRLFRPPYGKIKRSQVQALKGHYALVMWDVLSADFDQKVPADKVTKNVTSNAEEGSIVVFHDSLKAEERMKKALPETLAYFAGLGYTFEALSYELISG